MELPVTSHSFGPAMTGMGQTRPLRPPRQGAYAPPVVPRKRTDTGRTHRCRLGPLPDHAPHKNREDLTPLCLPLGTTGIIFVSVTCLDQLIASGWDVLGLRARHLARLHTEPADRGILSPCARCGGGKLRLYYITSMIPSSFSL